MFQYQQPCLLKIVWTKVSGFRRILAKILLQRETAVEEQPSRVVDITPNKFVEFKIQLLDANIEATSLSITNSIHGAHDSILSNKPLPSTKEF